MKTKLSYAEISKLWVNLVDSRNTFVEIPIKDYRFISPTSLCSLCSLIEHLAIKQKCVVKLLFPRLIDAFYPYIDSLLRLNSSDPAAIADFSINFPYYGKEEVVDSLRLLKFLSFLYFINFVDLWRDEDYANKVKIVNFDSSIFQNSHIYRGLAKSGRSVENSPFHRYSLIERISGTQDIRRASLHKILEDLLYNLPPEQKSMALFTDYEFMEVFLKQLEDNVAAHSDSNAYMIVRSFSPKDFKSKRALNAILPSCSKTLLKTCSQNGFLEIVISDCGPGLVTTLKPAYLDVLSKIVKTEEKVDDKKLDFEIMEFAFDEIGSRTVLEETKFRALIYQHNLNQILQYTRKYGGSIRLTTNNKSITYDTWRNISRGLFGLGFAAKRRENKYFNAGLNIRIILPHRPYKIRNYPKAAFASWPEMVPIESMVPYIRHMGVELGGAPTKNDIDIFASALTKWSIEKAIDKIALDFTGTEDWQIETVMSLLVNLQNVFSRIMCWGINVPASFIPEFETYFQNNPEKELSRMLSFPLITEKKSPEFYLVHPYLFQYSKGLQFIFERVELAPGEFINESFTLDVIISNIEAVSKRVVEERSFRRALSNNLHLFSMNEETNEWYTEYNMREMVYTAQANLRTNLLRILQGTKSIFSSNDPYEQRQRAFKLPSTGRVVNEYIWTYNLLQYGHYLDEISIRLYKLARQIVENAKLAINEVDCILCVTATARILSEAIAKLFPNRPAVLDLGTATRLDPENVISASTEKGMKKALIVSDVLSTNQTIFNIISLSKQNKLKIVGILALIKFAEENFNCWHETVEKLSFRQFFTKSCGSHTEKEICRNSYPAAYLYTYKKPTEVTQKGLPKNCKMYWIEPYSLKPYPKETLTETWYKWDRVERLRTIPQRIIEFDKHNCIIYGHFKDRSHHNRVMIHMRRALRDEGISLKICEDIWNTIKKHLPAMVVVPLHSNIHILVPRLKRFLREKGHSVPITCSIPVDSLSRSATYILPANAVEVLDKSKKKTVMFLDDGVLSGRTLDAFLRSLHDFVVRKETDLECVIVYCIINRLGRAGATKWRQIVSLFKSSTKFIFNDYIRFECPVYSESDCPVCRRISRYRLYLNDLSDWTKGIRDWALAEITKVQAVILNTREYDEIPVKALDLGAMKELLRIDGFPMTPRGRMADPKERAQVTRETVGTDQGALWWFWEKGFRGTPASYHIEEWCRKLFSDKKLGLVDRNRIAYEIFMWSFDHIDEVRSLSTWREFIPMSYELPKYFKSSMSKYIVTGDENIPALVEYGTNCLCDKNNFGLYKENIIDIFEMLVEGLPSQKEISNALNLLRAAELMIYVLRYHERLEETYETINDMLLTYIGKYPEMTGYYENIAEYVSRQRDGDSFIYSLKMLCQEKYKRRHGTILTIKDAVFLKRKWKKEYFGYLIDSLPRIESALHVVFSTKLSMHYPVKKEVDLLSRYVNRCKDIVLNMKDTQKSLDLRHWLAQIKAMIIRDNTYIGQGIDYYNPCLNNIIKDIGEKFSEFNGNVIFEFNENRPYFAFGEKKST